MMPRHQNGLVIVATTPAAIFPSGHPGTTLDGVNGGISRIRGCTDSIEALKKTRMTAVIMTRLRAVPPGKA